MSIAHGINAFKKTASPRDLNKSTVGIPFFVGAWPCHVAGGYTGLPQLAEGFEAAEALGGYSDAWHYKTAGAITGPKYNLCEAMYSHHKLYKMQPAIYMNVLDPETHFAAVAAADHNVVNHQVKLPIDAIIDSNLVVKSGPVYKKTVAISEGVFTASDAASITTGSLKVYADSTKATEFTLTTDYTISYTTPNLVITPVSGQAIESLSSVYVEAPFASQSTYVKDTDYSVFYSGEYCIVEVLPSPGAAYSATVLNIAYNAADPSKIDADDIESGIEAIEQCKTLLGVVPDLICIPGWSHTPAIAAVMAAKAASINGIFRAKAVVDVDTTESGADSYADVAGWKNTNDYTDANEIVCWPLVTLGGLVFHLSTQLCGLIAQTDLGNDGCPYESPSNLAMQIDGAIVASGAAVNNTVPQADILSTTAGVVTVLNFDGWKSWGNYTGAWGQDDAAPQDYFICCGRAIEWAMNVFVNTYWSKVDRPMSRVWRDSIIDSFNQWLSGLVHDGKFLAGHISYIEAANVGDDLADHIRLDMSMASPLPAQRIDLYAEYDADSITQSLTA